MKWNKEALILATPLNYITLQEPFTVLSCSHDHALFRFQALFFLIVLSKTPPE